jgi:hypothetical protein
LFLVLSCIAAAIAAVGNVVGLLAWERVYGDSYRSLTQQALAQDLVNLTVVVPVLIVAAVAVWRGSMRAWPVWLGALTFTVYNYVIYTMSVHFGPLFLCWVAVLGLALYALIGGALSVDPADVRVIDHPRTLRITAWFVIVMGAAFAALWLSDIVGSLRSGGAPASAAEIGTPTNPVHVLDLAVFLPAVVAAGVLALRHRSIGVVATPALLVFLVLTGLPILVTPFVAVTLGWPASWGVTGPIGVITVIGVALEWAYLRAISARRSATIAGAGGL